VTVVEVVAIAAEEIMEVEVLAIVVAAIAAEEIMEVEVLAIVVAAEEEIAAVVAVGTNEYPLRCMM
jgi:hypothetical protein